MIHKFIHYSLVFLCFSQVKAQSVSPKEIVNLALEHNYGIKVANNNTAVATNNAGILNSNYLPSISASGVGSYNIQDIEANTNDGNTTILEDAVSSNYNASIDLNYTIFDGLGRVYNYKKLKKQKNLTELQTRETIENTILQLFSVYYSLAETIENEVVFAETLEISKARLKRSQYQFDYGQNTKLEVLNAEVDISTDTINLMNASQSLVNFKRDLNLVVGNALSENYEIETEVNFNKLYQKETLLQKARNNNVSLLQAEENINISNLSLKVNTSSTYLPTVGLLGSYGWNKSNNNSASFLSSSITTGITGGLTLSWNLFDGGNTLTKIRNSRLDIATQKIKKQELKVTLERDFNNAWDDYQNKLKIYHLQENNIKTAENNFNRTEEKFKLGQVTSIDFRQAQLNLLNAQLSKNKAKYQAKLAELTMLQISGEILNVEI